MLNQNDPDGYLWTDETHEPHNHTVYRYGLDGDGLVDSPDSLSTEGPVIGVGNHNDSIYIASCNQTDDLVVQRINTTSWQLSEPIPVAELNLTFPAASDDTLATDNDTLLLVPRHAIVSEDGADGQLKVWQVSLPPYGGKAQWRAQGKEKAALRLDQQVCLRVTEDEPSNSLPVPFEGPLIGTAIATYGLCCTAAVAGIICKKCWQRHKKHTGATTAPPASTEAANDPEAAMELQEKSNNDGEQSA